MPYTPDATVVTQPDPATVKASTAALEFQTIKLYMRDVLLAGLALKAPIASPTFTGTSTHANISVSGAAALTNLTVSGSAAFTASPTVPNITAGDSSTKSANTAFVMNAIAAAVFAAVLPSQAGNAGKIVSTDGTNAGWIALAKTPWTAVAGTTYTATSGEACSMNNVAVSTLSAPATPATDAVFAYRATNGLTTNLIDFGAAGLNGIAGQIQMTNTYAVYKFQYDGTTWRFTV